MLTIDGSTLEGGGQLTRLTLALSAITRVPVRIHSIRAGRASKRGTGSGGKGAAPGRPQTRTQDRNQDRRGHASGRAAAKTSYHHIESGGNSTGGGLKDSHLAALDFLAEHCGARVEGAEVGSTQVVFRPSQPRNGNASGSTRASGVRFTAVAGGKGLSIRLKKPGSVWLIFQAVYPFLVFGADWSSTASGDSGRDGDGDSAESTLVLSLAGGTNVPQAMSSEYVAQVFAPIAEQIGLPRIEVETVRRGWAGTPSEIGEVKVRVHRPASSNLSADGRFVLPGFSIVDRGSVSRIDITIVAYPVSTGEKLVEMLSSLLCTSFPDVPLQVVTNESSGDDRRLYILLVAHTSNGWRLGRDFLGSSRGKNVTETKKKLDEACLAVTKGLEREIAGGGCVDKHMQDQLVGFQALAEGKSTVVGGGLRQQQVGDSGEAVRTDLGDLYVDEDGDEVDSEKIEKVGDDGGTLHTRTVRWVCEMMLAEHRVRFEEGGICHGIGWNGKSDEKDDDRVPDLKDLKINNDDDDRNE